MSLWILIIPKTNYEFLSVNASSLITSIIALILLIIIFRKINKQEILNFNGTKNVCYLFAIILGIGFVMTFPVLNAIYGLGENEYISSYSISFENLWSLYAIDIIIVVPVLEELFFRNYIQKGLSKLYNPITSIIVTAILFSFIHIQVFALFTYYLDFSLYSSFFAFFGGLISGYLYYKSKSLIPSILFHMTWNLLVTIIV